MPEGKRKKKLSPNEFIKKYGPAIKAGRQKDSPWQSGRKLTADLESYRTPIPWGELDKTRLSELMSGIQYRAPRVPLDELRESWITELLNEAAGADEPEAFKALLLELLTSLGVRVPDGVLTVWSKPLGAPKKEQTRAIHDCWTKLGRPSPHKKTLAQTFFGKEFNTASPDGRKKLTDLCRRAVERAKQSRPTKIRQDKVGKKIAD